MHRSKYRLFVVALFLATTAHCGGNDNIGQGTLADLHLPERVVLSQTRIGTSETRSIEVKNTGSSPVEITSAKIIERDGDSKQELTRGGRWLSNGQLQPGESRIVDIAFKPKTVDPIQGKLTFETKAQGAKSLAIQTPRLGPTITSPGTLRFRNVSPGQKVTRLLSVKNTGTSALALEDILLQKGNDSAFSVKHPSLPVDGIEPGAEKTLKVAFQPEQEGSSEDQLLIWSNDSKRQEYSIDLVGGAEGPCLSTDLGDRVSFQDTLVGETSTKTGTLTNCSDSKPLKVSNIAIDGRNADAFSVDRDGNGEIGKIPVGESVHLRLEFSPSGERPHRAKLTVENNDPIRGRLEVGLRGRGFLEDDVTPGEDVPINCGKGNIKMVDNIEDVRPNESEDNCTIFIFPERKNVKLEEPLMVDVTTERDPSHKPRQGNKRVEPQRVNIYHGHYDRVGKKVWERSQGTFTFDNKILGLALHRDTLDETNGVLSGCRIDGPGPKCQSGDTVYPVGKEYHSYFAIDYGNWNAAANNGRDRVIITGEKTIRAHLSTNGNTDNFRIITRAD